MTEITAAELNRKIDQCLKEVHKELKGIWSKLDEYSKCDINQERVLATLSIQMTNLDKAIEELFKKANGGVGSSRMCIQHHDSIESVIRDLNLAKIQYQQLSDKYHTKIERIFKEIAVLKKAMYIAFGVFLALQFLMPFWVSERSSDSQVNQILKAIEEHDKKTPYTWEGIHPNE